ncbi:hypothetical protein [Mycolicibacterium fortuitum]|uniref:hypothetical protein n=1 Tax=Mycolicibacterium fortuitum TaxID=1766 RepID=UPI0007EB7761|nr:hypothetical protein [Mycolicibacterium fortuitum]OBF77094.1 hypothetical protein A5751_23230 [Mycolicibacterium fortuitum]
MVRIRYNRSAWRKIRHAYANHVAARAEQIRRTLPDGYELVVQRDPSTQRPRAYIVAREIPAMIDDAENGSLLKAVSAARGS